MSSHLSSSNSTSNFPAGKPQTFAEKTSNFESELSNFDLRLPNSDLRPQTFQAICQTFGNNCQTFLSNFSYSCRFHTANIWDPEKFGVEIKVWEKSLTIVSKSLGFWDQSLRVSDQSLEVWDQSLTILIQSLMFSAQKFGVSPPESLMFEFELERWLLILLRFHSTVYCIV